MAFQPMPLSRKPAPFDHPEWVFELKYDGFRSLAVIHDGRCQLVSRNGHSFASFPELQKSLTSPHSGKTVFDGEIVCLDKRGKPQFRDLLFHRGEPCFFAFDLLMSDGKDLRLERLTDRKHELRRVLSRTPESSIRYVEHIEHQGKALFDRVCQMDLEGIVAKHAFGIYVTERERTTWFKIKNKNYSQMTGREELFNRERHKEPVSGWHPVIWHVLNDRGSMKKPSSPTNISEELTRLLPQQTDYFKTLSPTAGQSEEYEQSRDRVRELFAQLAKSKAAWSWMKLANSYMPLAGQIKAMRVGSLQLLSVLIAGQRYALTVRCNAVKNRSAVNVTITT